MSTFRPLLRAFDVRAGGDLYRAILDVTRGHVLFFAVLFICLVRQAMSTEELLVFQPRSSGNKHFITALVLIYES